MCQALGQSESGQGESGQRELTSEASADLRFAAWFGWITPLDAALSRLRDAAANSTCAVALSPASAALRTRRTAVFSADLTDLVRMRLIWDLILATPDCLRFVGGMVPDARAGPGAHDLRGYQLGWWLPKSAPSSARR